MNEAHVGKIIAILYDTNAYSTKTGIKSGSTTEMLKIVLFEQFLIIFYTVRSLLATPPNTTNLLRERNFFIVSGDI